MHTRLRVVAATAIIATLAVGSNATAARPGSSTAHAADVTLLQWYHEYGESGTHAAVLRYAKEYAQSHGININVAWTPGDWATKLATSLLGNTAPDVYEYEYVTLANVRAGQVAPLDDLFTPAVRRDFDPRALQVNTINGHIYGVPMLTDVRLLYYRKSLFQKAGITKAPSTFAELLSDAKLLTKNGVKGLYLGNDGGTSGLENTLVWSSGSDLVQGNKVVFDNARTVAALQELRTLNKAGVLLLGAPTDWFDPSAFDQGLTAMQWSGLWAMPTVKKALGDDFGVVPWPALDEKSSPATWWVGWNEYVNAKSKNVAVAKDFVKWLWIQQTQLQADWNVGYGFHVPARASAVTAAAKLKSGQAADAVSLLHKYAHVLPATFDAAMTTALDDAVSSAVKSDQSIPSLVHAAAVKAQAELTRELKG